jgi:hypothetical protein
MTDRIVLFIGALSGILLIALVAGVTSIVMGSPVQAQSTGVSNARQVTVVGNGEATGTPDTARVEIGVETSAPTTGEALQRNNEQVEAVINRLKDLGVAESDIQTSNFNMYAQYNDEGRQITGYNVSNTVSVTIRNLDQTGSLLDEVVQVGANRIYGISFRVDDPTALMEQARDEAIANARQKAERLAQQSGASLGEVLVITENIGSAPGPMPLGRGGGMPAAEQAAADVPVEAGEQRFNTNVQVTYELR